MICNTCDGEGFVLGLTEGVVVTKPCPDCDGEGAISDDCIEAREEEDPDYDYDQDCSELAGLMEAADEL